MASFHRVRAAETIVAAFVLVTLLADPVDALAPARTVVVVTLPADEARAFIADRTLAVGVGVFPESHDPLHFIEEIGYGAPHSAEVSSPDERPARLGDALQQANIRVVPTGTTGLDGGASRIQRVLQQAFLPTRPAPLSEAPQSLASFALERASDLELRVRRADVETEFLVMGVDTRTPILLASCRAPCREGSSSPAILGGGIARRPAIVTPYDVGVTIMHRFGVRKPMRMIGPGPAHTLSDAFIGNVLETEAKTDALSYVDRIERRLVRDASAGSTAAVVTDAITVIVLLFGVFLVVAGRPGIAARGAVGGWTAVAVGYPVSRFLSSGSGTVRAIPVAIAFLLGVALRPERSVRTARIFFGVAIATALMFALAPLNPGGEPGLSIWGNPLTSWRFFGMQNAWAATIAAGVVVWGVLAGLGTRALVGVGAAVAIVMGAPRIGANFVGVLTFTFGAVLAALALARRKLELVHVVIAGATAVIAFLLALLADVGSPVSHGGRAAEQISDGGISTAWDFVTGRIRLNVDLIRGFWGGVVWVVLFIAALLLLARWGAKVADGPLRARAAVWAGSMMALASFVLEDSGFYSGTTLLGAVVAAWIVNAAAISRTGTDPASAPGDG